MKKLIFILFVLVASNGYAQKRCLILDVNKSYIAYNGYNGSELIALNQRYYLSNYNYTNKALRDSILSNFDSILNISFSNFYNVNLTLGNSWSVNVDSIRIIGDRFSAYCRVLDDTSGVVMSGVLSRTNSREYAAQQIRTYIQLKGLEYKNAELFVRSKQQFIGTVISE